MNDVQHQHATINQLPSGRVHSLGHRKKTWHRERMLLGGASVEPGIPVPHGIATLARQVWPYQYNERLPLPGTEQGRRWREELPPHARRGGRHTCAVGEEGDRISCLPQNPALRG